MQAYESKLAIGWLMVVGVLGCEAEHLHQATLGLREAVDRVVIDREAHQRNLN